MSDQAKNGGDDDTIVQPAVGDGPVRKVAPPSASPKVATPQAQVRPAAQPAAQPTVPPEPVKNKTAQNQGPQDPAKKLNAGASRAGSDLSGSAADDSATPAPGKFGTSPHLPESQPKPANLSDADDDTRPRPAVVQNKPADGSDATPPAKNAGSRPGGKVRPSTRNADKKPGQPGTAAQRGNKAGARAAAAAAGGAAAGGAAGLAAGTAASGGSAAGGTPNAPAGRAGAATGNVTGPKGPDSKGTDSTKPDTKGAGSADATGNDPVGDATKSAPGTKADTSADLSDATETKALNAATVEPDKKPDSPRMAAVKRAVGNPTTHRTRKARLRLAKFDPWSVMKTTFLFSIAFAIAGLAAMMMLYGVISSSGVFDSINEIVGQVLASPGDTQPFLIQDFLTARRVAGFTVVVGVLNVVLLTAIGTLAAFLYNLAASLLGGLEVTLAED